MAVSASAIVTSILWNVALQWFKLVASHLSQDPGRATSLGINYLLQLVGGLESSCSIPGTEWIMWTILHMQLYTDVSWVMMVFHANKPTVSWKHCKLEMHIGIAIVVQWVKPMSHPLRMLVWGLAPPLPIQLNVHAPGKVAVGGPSAWGPAATLDSWMEFRALGCSLTSGSGCCGFWIVDQQMKDSLCI